jgi:hypothetical protein
MHKALAILVRTCVRHALLFESVESVAHKLIEENYMENGTKIVCGVAVCIAIGVASHYARTTEHIYSPAEAASNAAEARSEAVSAAIAAKAATEAEKNDPKRIASARYYYAAKGALIVQSEMRNPESFQLVTVGDMQSGALCYVYRAQNGFGGMNPGHATYVKNVVIVDGTEIAWKKICVGKPGADITAKVQGMMEFARTGKMTL